MKKGGRKARLKLRRPLGLVLAGGGAHGAWQAGCLDALAHSGLRFDKLLGFSTGALSAAGYFMGRMPELMRRWRDVDRGRILRLSPRFGPVSLFNAEAIWESVGYAKNEEGVRKKARCELVVVSLCVDDDLPVYSRFTPSGGRAWDGPLADRLVASCAIPTIFPPVRIRSRTYVDGVVPGRQRMRFDALAGCKDVLVVQMVRPEEVGRRYWRPWMRYDQMGREVMLSQITSGLDSLRRLKKSPRVFRLFPSQTLDFGMLSFRSRYCAPAMELGSADAKAFLSAPPHSEN